MIKCSQLTEEQWSSKTVFFLCGDKTFACFYLSKEAEKVLFHYVSCTHKFATSSCLSCRYRSITKQFFRKADGVVVMYDITTEESFTAVRQWLTSVKVRQYQSQKHHNPIFVFCFILLTCYKKQTNYIKKQKNKAVLACALSLTCFTGRGRWGHPRHAPGKQNRQGDSKRSSEKYRRKISQGLCLLLLLSMRFCFSHC